MLYFVITSDGEERELGFLLSITLNSVVSVRRSTLKDFKNAKKMKIIFLHPELLNMLLLTGKIDW